MGLMMLFGGTETGFKRQVCIIDIIAIHSLLISRLFSKLDD